MILYYCGDLHYLDGGGLALETHSIQTRKQNEIVFRTPLVAAHNYTRSDHVVINPMLYII